MVQLSVEIIHHTYVLCTHKFRCKFRWVFYIYGCGRTCHKWHISDISAEVHKFHVINNFPNWKAININLKFIHQKLYTVQQNVWTHPTNTSTKYKLSITHSIQIDFLKIYLLNSEYIVQINLWNSNYARCALYEFP